MVAEQFNLNSLRKPQRPPAKIAVAVVDQWHKDWAKVLADVNRAGHRSILMLDRDGWLSARQSVVAAFFDGEVIGHLIFHVAPVVSDRGGIELEARVDTVSVAPAYQSKDVEALLNAAGEQHARSVLQCRSFKSGKADPNA